MKKIKNFIRKQKLNYYNWMLSYCHDGYETARIDGDDQECKYWSKRYDEYLSKKVLLVEKMKG